MSGGPDYQALPPETPILPVVELEYTAVYQTAA